jgi:hypothetical protein
MGKITQPFDLKAPERPINKINTVPKRTIVTQLMRTVYCE